MGSSFTLNTLLGSMILWEYLYMWTFKLLFYEARFFIHLIKKYSGNPEKTIIQKDTRNPMFIRALFTIAKK